MQSRPLPPLITPPPTTQRQNKQLLLAVLVCSGLMGVGVIVWKMRGNPPLPPAELRERPPSEQTVVGTPSLPREDLRLPTSYQRLPLSQALPPVAPVRPTTTTPPMLGAPVTPASTSQSLPPAPPPPAPPRGLPPPPGMPPASQPQATPAPAPRPARPKEPPKRWFSAATPPQGDVMTPPLPEDPKEAEAKAADSKLFPKAVWETPADPYKVLYADQVVQGQLMTNLDSDIPGTVRVKTTEAVMDRWGHGQVIIPLDTTFLGKQEGMTGYGQRLIPAQITMAIFPNGTAIRWNQGQAGDAMGSTGIPANVDNHYGKLLLGVGLQALLSVGVRAPFGNTTSFNPTLPQEFAQEATQGVNQAGQNAIRQQFSVRPTLTQEQGFPVTLSFAENISFATKPILVTK